ncbi:chitinase [Sinomicrobium pectinilyticum]|uniref:Chitinase n=2 Tax=Sinomicrobium pectinilyticum TaxID=1084421 RepID=A0A3N0DQL6_SINP1|nr:chitinase [Sinomicrobium pectinilyticum]
MKTKWILGLVIFTGLFGSCDFPLAGGEPGEAEPDSNAVKDGPLSVVYVEVNNHNLLNVGSYTLEESGAQYFDMAMIFASNINYDADRKKTVLYHNPNVTEVLNNKEKYIKPLQDKGIKVLLSILGNHQGVGFANFTSRAAAKDFAQQLRKAVEDYDLDGIDFDDEWAKYGTNGQPVANDSSFVMLVQETRKLMPNKIISLYDIGEAAQYTEWNGTRVGELIDYSWQAYYGSYGAPRISGLEDKNRLGPAAVWINRQPYDPLEAANLARRTMDDGYGIFLQYDLKQENASSYLSAIGQELYGENVILSGETYTKE